MDNGVAPSLDRTVETITSASSKWIGAGSGSDACNDFIAESGAYPMADEPGTTLSNGPATECQEFTHTAGSFAAAAADSMSQKNFVVIDEAVDASDRPDAGKVR